MFSIVTKSCVYYHHSGPGTFRDIIKVQFRAAAACATSAGSVGRLDFGSLRSTSEHLVVPGASPAQVWRQIQTFERLEGGLTRHGDLGKVWGFAGAAIKGRLENNEQLYTHEHTHIPDQPPQGGQLVTSLPCTRGTIVPSWAMIFSH